MEEKTRDERHSFDGGGSRSGRGRSLEQLAEPCLLKVSERSGKGRGPYERNAGEDATSGNSEAIEGAGEEDAEGCRECIIIKAEETEKKGGGRRVMLPGFFFLSPSSLVAGLVSLPASPSLAISQRSHNPDSISPGFYNQTRHP